MNIFKTILISVFLFFSISTYAENKFQVIDKGLDGNQRQYLVTCLDGSRSSVTLHFILQEVTGDLQKIPTDTRELTRDSEVRTRQIPKKLVSPPKLNKVCVTLNNGDEKCQPKWNLDEAAKTSCSL